MSETTNETTQKPRSLDGLVRLIEQAGRTATIKHDDRGHEVVCLQPHMWDEIYKAVCKANT